MHLFLIDPNAMLQIAMAFREPTKNIDSFDTMHLFLVDPDVTNSFYNP
jgi:hypothetical protein